MRVISAPQEFTVPDLYVDLRRFVGRDLFVKCEGFNFAGSIKLKAALEIVERAEREGTLRPGQTIVESSSGNIGVALAMVAASRGYRFICVTDDHCTLSARQLMQNYGAEVRVLTEPHPVDGLVGARQRLVESLCAEHEDYVWLDQHTNPGNWTAHYRTTGPEILRMFPGLDVLFVGTGTAGTLMGCARYLREARRSIRVVAVDSRGRGGFPGSAPRSARRCSTSPWWTTWCTSRKPKPWRCAGRWCGTGSCSAARPAPSSPERFPGSPARTAT